MCLVLSLQIEFVSGTKAPTASSSTAASQGKLSVNVTIMHTALCVIIKYIIRIKIV